MKHFRILLPLVPLLLLPIAISSYRGLGLSDQVYSVFFAPGLEEAFKMALLWVVVVFIVSPKVSGHRGTWLAGGYLMGLCYGVVEHFGSAIGMVSAFATHALWTMAAGGGIYLARKGGRRGALEMVAVYILVTAAHMMWNWGVHFGPVELLMVAVVPAAVGVGVVAFELL